MTKAQQIKQTLDSLTETLDSTIKARADNWNLMSDLEDTARQTAHYCYSAQIKALRSIHAQWNILYQEELAAEQGY